MKKYDFEKYFDCLLKIIPLNIIALIALTLYRVFFFLHFADFSTLHGMTGYILKAFWLGFRFDLSVLAYVNSVVIVILTLLLLFRSVLLFKLSVFIIKFYYWIAFTAIAFIAAVDFGFYTFFGERINLLIFEFFSDDTTTLIRTIIRDWRFPIAAAALVIVSVIFYKLSSWTAKKFADRHSLIDTSFWGRLSKTFIVLLTLFLTFAFARGTFKMFPLGAFYTQISPNAFVNKIPISSVHALTDAIGAKSEQSKDINVAQKLGVPEESIDLSILDKTSQYNAAAEKIRPNVVLIVMEDFGEMPVLYNSPQFDVLGGLKKHFDEDTVFYNFLPSGRITVEALESTILDMPQRPFALQVTQSPDAYKEYSSAIAGTYKSAGYETMAVYGGSLQWRAIDSFFKAQGFDETYGEGDIKNEYRHQWGINDEQFYELIMRELAKSGDKPKFIYAMSTGAHVPYYTPPYYKPLPLNVPEELMAKMPNQTKEYAHGMFEAYQFANAQAAKFLDAVKKSPLAENTIIVITGDHNFKEFSLTPEETFKKFAVPMYIYIPKSLKKNLDTDVIGSHMDIVPTLYDLSLSKVKYVGAGTSLLAPGRHIVFNGYGFILSGDKAVLYDINSGTAQYFTFDKKTKMLALTQSTKDHEAMIAYYKKIISASDVYLKRSNSREEQK